MTPAATGVLYQVRDCRQGRQSLEGCCDAARCRGEIMCWAGGEPWPKYESWPRLTACRSLMRRAKRTANAMQELATLSQAGSARKSFNEGMPYECHSSNASYHSSHVHGAQMHMRLIARPRPSISSTWLQLVQTRRRIQTSVCNCSLT